MTEPGEAERLKDVLDWFNGDGESLVYRAIEDVAEDGRYNAKHVAQYSCDAIARLLREQLLAAPRPDAGDGTGERVEGWTGKPCPCPNCGAIRNERDAHFCSSTRAASAGVVCWAARDGNRTAWLFQSEPEWHEDSGAWVNAEADMTVAVPLRDETAESLGLVPGECARVRITKLDEEPTRT